jgi:hypothetical protein
MKNERFAGPGRMQITSKQGAKQAPLPSGERSPRRSPTVGNSSREEGEGEWERRWRKGGSVRRG